MSYWKKSFEGFPTLQLTCSLDASWLILFRCQFSPFEVLTELIQEKMFCNIEVEIATTIDASCKV